MLIDDFLEIDWLEPWYFSVSGLENELRREVSSRHPLYRAKALALGRRRDNDDVLFLISDREPPLAVVHLTWRHENSVDRPHTVFYTSIQDFIDRRMKPDHAEYKFSSS
jgi:hypothetical protein